LDCDVHESRPFIREIVVKDLLEDWDELLSNLRWGGCEDGKEALSKSALLIFWYRFVLCLLVW
jgi:hypothetical protein